MTIDILLVDDQPLIRMGTAMVVGAEPDLRIVAEAGDGGTGVDRARALRPDVVLMDIRMPGMDGIEATRRIVEERPDARVLILTTFDLDEYAFAGLNAGASGFLLKDAPPSELVAAIRTIAAGDAIVSPRATRAVLEQVRNTLPSRRPDDDGRNGDDRDNDGNTGRDGAADTWSGAAVDPASVLSTREREVLQAIGRGQTNGEIAAALFLSESTVKTHVGRVLAKLELRDRVHAVIWCYEHGLV